MTPTVLLALVGVALGVIFYLPHLAEHRTVSPSAGRTVQLTAENPAGDLSPTARVEELEDLAVLQQQMEEVRDRVMSLQRELETKSPSTWGGKAYFDALALVKEGDQQAAERDFASAATSYEEALAHLESVKARAAQALEDALAEGRRALSAGNSSAAEKAFGLAAAIEPDNREASQGARRAGVLDEVLAFLASGEASERKGDLGGAAQLYRKALSLDPLSEPAGQALARIDRRFADQSFAEAMSEAVTALEHGDFAAAKMAFQRAGAIRPEAPQVASGLAQAEEGLRSEQIRELRDRALTHEQKEDWRAASEAYQVVLNIDPSIRFAQVGKARTLERADLSDRLDFHIRNPHRLSDERVLGEVSTLVQSASSIEPSGDRLRGQISTLQELLRRASTPVKVRLLSDELTDVVIYRVGRLGAFASHEIDLRPGTYTIVGTRSGYRDVRFQLTVAAGEAPGTVVVKCEEPI